MNRRRARLVGYAVSGAAIVAFGAVLVFALIELSRTEGQLRANRGDNMLWAISRAQLAMEALDAAAARRVAGEASAKQLNLRYDIALSRVNLLTAGPQQRYLERLGHAAILAPQMQAVRGLESEIADLAPLDYASARDIRDTLGPLVRELGRTANSSMVARLEETGAWHDSLSSGIEQVSVSIIAILLLGLIISASMVRVIAARERAQRSLEHEQELREVYRTFVALVSHQFQTPLSVIDASAQRLIRQGDDNAPGDVVTRARRIRGVVHELTILVGSTLDAIRLEGGQVRVEMRGCNVADLMEQVRSRHVETDTRHAITLEIAEAVPTHVRTDPVLVEQVLANLLSNALKYAPDTGPVEMRADVAGERLVLTVRDRGPGVPEAEREQIFEDFTRAATSRGLPGRGVGLNVSRKIAELLGGRLTLAEDAGPGAVFVFEIPLSPVPE